MTMIAPLLELMHIEDSYSYKRYENLVSCSCLKWNEGKGGKRRPPPINKSSDLNPIQSNSIEIDSWQEWDIPHQANAWQNEEHNSTADITS